MTTGTPRAARSGFAGVDAVCTVVARLRWAVAAILMACLAVSASAETVVVVSSDSLTSTRRTISGARSAIRAERDDVEFVYVQLQTASGSIQEQLEEIAAADPDLILTVGSAATRVAREGFPDKPIVFSSVMYPVISGFVESIEQPGNNMTGASLDIPVDIQFRYFRQIVPDLDEVGVLYTSNTAPLIPEATGVAAEMGITLHALEVASHKDLPRALDSLCTFVDGLWSVADQNLFDPQSTKYILLNSLRHGVPFMGFSRYVVESGALFALDFDYKAIGRQAGSQATAILDGAEPGTMPVTVPDIIWFHYNEKTAVHIDINIPNDLVAIAKEVYR
ncbi:hypothetical protein GF377_02700 [candidate division GN15 bacterium]|nr:hypothetical protein [candidate division GN15 bacterium]